MADLRTQRIKLRTKYDLEHLTVTNLQTELAALKRPAQNPALNPLAKQVAALKRTLSEQERTISAYSAAINSLRDDPKWPRKINWQGRLSASSSQPSRVQGNGYLLWRGI